MITVKDSLINPRQVDAKTESNITRSEIRSIILMLLKIIKF